MVEIDLLRGNAHLPMYGDVQLTDYSILVSVASRRPLADLYAFTMKEPLPNFPLPLALPPFLRGARGDLPLAPDEVIWVPLQEIVRGVYDRASYDLRINYRESLPPPSLKAVDRSWVDALLESYRSS